MPTGIYKRKDLKTRFLEKIKSKDSNGCMLFNSIGENGYGKFSIKHKDILAHRTSWIIFKGKIPNKMNVLHKCDVRGCVNPDHLFLGNHSDNMKDMVKKNRSLVGELNGSSKLTELEVIKIKSLLKSKELNQTEISKLFGVSPSMISLIYKNKKWKYLLK